MLNFNRAFGIGVTNTYILFASILGLGIVRVCNICMGLDSETGKKVDKK